MNIKVAIARWLSLRIQDRHVSNVAPSETILARNLEGCAERKYAAVGSAFTRPGHSEA
jgi:hypothetical protein